jgi:hypothetical protein
MVSSIRCPTASHTRSPVWWLPQSKAECTGASREWPTPGLPSDRQIERRTSSLGERVRTSAACDRRPRALDFRIDLASDVDIEIVAEDGWREPDTDVGASKKGGLGFAR